MTATASLVVDFGQRSDAMLKAELYDELNNSRSSFLPTESVYFLTFASDNVVVDTPVPSDGDIIDMGYVTLDKEDILTFAGSLDASLSYPAYGGVTLDRWYGRIGSDFKIDTNVGYVSGETPCICKVSYKTRARIWQLVPPAGIKDEIEYQIVVYITGTVA